MSKFKTGDSVSPKSGYIGSESNFIISDYDIVRRRYKLTTIGLREPNSTDKQVMMADWEENELEFCYKPPIRYSTTIIKPNDIKIKINPALLHESPFDNELCKIESEEINMKNILEIYKERKRAKIDSEHTEMKKTLKEQDKISQIIAETNKLIQEIEPTRVFPVISSGLYTTETLEKEKEIDKEYKEELKKLDELIEEVEGYFAMTTDFTERKAILRNYEIIDKKGKLII